MKQRIKIAVVIVIAAGVAAGGAAWKWRAPAVKPSSYKIAGWSWGSGHSHVKRHADDDGPDGGDAIGQDA